MHTIVWSYVTSVEPLARAPYVVLFDLKLAPYVVLFDLKPLNKDGNWQVGTYCMHAHKGTWEVLRTYFRACKISKFSGGLPPDPLTQYGAHFCICLGPPQSSRRPWPCQRTDHSLERLPWVTAVSILCFQSNGNLTEVMGYKHIWTGVVKFTVFLQVYLRKVFQKL